MKRKSLRLICGIVLLGASIATGSSLAWFTATAKIGSGGTHLPIESGTESGYFAYGNGSSDNPYGIRTPRQLYNLAWLQFLGLIHLDTQQLYFELADNIDMTNWVLPPIGTETYPFIGNFNGKGYVISNLTISNKFGDYNDHPSVISNFGTTTNLQPHILGMFGVVGNTKNVTGYSSSVNEFTNTGLYNATINTYTYNSLMGVAAGYVKDDGGIAHNAMKNIVIDNSTVNIDSSISSATASYGGYTNNVSDFTLVGYTNKKNSVEMATQTTYGINIDNNITFNATEDGNSNGWGGSIDMKSVLGRLQTIRDTKYTATNYAYKKTYNHHANGTDDDPISVNRTGSNVRLMVDDTNHKEWGHFNFAYDNSTVQSNYAQLGGGHLRTDNNYSYNSHNAFQISNGTQYLKISSGNIDKTTTQSDGTYWYLTNNNYLVTNIGNTFYYLRNNNGTLQTTTNTNNASAWTIDDSGTNRLITNTLSGATYAITYYNNNFVLSSVSIGNPYYIRYQNTNNYLSVSGTSVANSTSVKKIWNFTSTSSNTTISTTINGTTYYLYPRNASSYDELRLGTTQQNWTWGTNGNYITLTLANAANNSYRKLSFYPSDSEWYLSKNDNYKSLSIEGTATYTYPINLTKTASSGTVSGPDESITSSTTKMDYSENDVTYFPLSTVNNTDNFNPAENNTAYITAGYNIPTNASAGDFTSLYTMVRFGQGFYLHEANSKPAAISTDDFDLNTGTFKKMYTVNDSGSRQDITSELTNADTELTRLKDSASSLGNVLKKSNNNDERVYGVHFMNATISMDAITTAKYVSMNNVSYEDYQLPVNSIDFNLKEYGFITFIAGTYYNNSSSDRNNSFFALYQIERKLDKPKEINRILEIKNVYQHKDKTKTYSYVYELTDGTSTFYTKPYRITNSEGGKLFLDGTTYTKNTYVNTKPSDYTISLFNTNRIKKNNIASGTFDYHPYFFQIPMNDGEFCLGSVEGATGAYLMYLDIGANAAKTHRTIFYEKFSTTNKIFYHPVGVSLGTLPATTTSGTATINMAAVIDSSDSACMVIKATSKGTFKMDRDGSDVTLTRTQPANAPPSYSGGNVTSVHELNSSTNLEIVPTSSSTKDIVRMQYYDYMINTDTLVVTTFTDTSTDGGDTYSRVVEQSRYSGHLVDSTKLVVSYSSEVSGDVDKMKIYRSDTGVKYTSSEITNTGALPISSLRLSNTAILKIDMLLDNVSDYTDVITLMVAVDQSFGSDIYYTFDSYSIVITPESGTITIKVIDYAGNITISVVNVGGNNATSTKTVTNSETINGTGVTGTGQTITIEYQEPANPNPAP